MIYKGIVSIRKEFESSKSEGNYAYLNTEEGEYRLFRMEVYPADDNLFYPFEGKNVEIEGTVTDGWLSVGKISEISEDSTAIEDNVENTLNHDIENNTRSKENSCKCNNPKEENEENML